MRLTLEVSLTLPPDVVSYPHLPHVSMSRKAADSCAVHIARPSWLPRHASNIWCALAMGALVAHPRRRRNRYICGDLDRSSKLFGILGQPRRQEHCQSHFKTEEGLLCEGGWVGEGGWKHGKVWVWDGGVDGTVRCWSALRWSVGDHVAQRSGCHEPSISA